MMNKLDLVANVKNGHTVTIQLKDAEVISVKDGVYYPSTVYHPRYRSWYGRSSVSTRSGTRYLKVVVKDPELGVLFFKTYSSKLTDLCKGDKISLKVTVTGIGDATERYPDPILFAKAHTRKGDSLSIDKPIVSEPDLTVNV